jgi:hypothetical protein
MDHLSGATIVSHPIMVHGMDVSACRAVDREAAGGSLGGIGIAVAPGLLHAQVTGLDQFIQRGVSALAREERAFGLRDGVQVILHARERNRLRGRAHFSAVGRPNGFR